MAAPIVPVLMALANLAMLVQGGAAVYDTYKKMNGSTKEGTRFLTGKSPTSTEVTNNVPLSQGELIRLSRKNTIPEGSRIIPYRPPGSGVMYNQPKITAKSGGMPLSKALKGNKLSILFGVMGLADLLSGLGRGEESPQAELDPQILSQISQMQQMNNAPQTPRVGGMNVSLDSSQLDIESLLNLINSM